MKFIIIIILLFSIKIQAKDIEWHQGNGYIYTKVDSEVLNLVIYDDNNFYVGGSNGAYYIDKQNSLIDTLYQGKECFVSGDMKTFIANYYQAGDYYKVYEVYDLESKQFLFKDVAAVAGNYTNTPSGNINDYKIDCYNSELVLFSISGGSSWYDYHWKCTFYYGRKTYYTLKNDYLFKSYYTSLQRGIDDTPEINQHIVLSNLTTNDTISFFENFNDRYSTAEFNEDATMMAIANNDSIYLYNIEENLIEFSFNNLIHDENEPELFQFNQNQIFICRDNLIYVYDIHSKEYISKFILPDSLIINDIEVLNGKIYLGTKSGEVIIINRYDLIPMNVANITLNIESRAYPNPFQDNFNIQFTSIGIENAKLLIYDNLNRVLIRKDYFTNIGNNIIEFAMDEYPAGIYYYSIVLHNDVYWGKVLKY